MAVQNESLDDGPARELEEYLRERVKDGDRFFKSRFIATDVDYPTKRIGQLMRIIQAESANLDVSDWGGNSDGITWYIEPMDG